MLWGLAGDPPLEAVRRELARSDLPYVLLDQARTWECRAALEPGAKLSGRITLDDRVIDVDEIAAVFVRTYDIRDVLERSHGAACGRDALHAAVSLEQQLFAWAESTDVPVINRPSAIASNASKPFQAELIARNGFEIPATLVTTTPDDAREFIAHHGQVIYKSVSYVRSMASRVASSDLEALDDVANCPTQFQAYVPGNDWRVHVVGDDLFACEIVCAADDYRCAELQGIALEIRTAVLPAAVAARCHALARALELPLAGIDLRRTDDDAWYCFEVNPCPAFTYYEHATGQPLGAAVARLLGAALGKAA